MSMFMENRVALGMRIKVNHGMESKNEQNSRRELSVNVGKTGGASVTEHLKGHPKESDLILEAEVSLEQSNMIVHFRNLIFQLIRKRLKARRLTSIIHVLDEKN